VSDAPRGSHRKKERQGEKEGARPSLEHDRCLSCFGDISEQEIFTSGFTCQADDAAKNATDAPRPVEISIAPGT
jgi:hypothetical protein